MHKVLGWNEYDDRGWCLTDDEPVELIKNPLLQLSVECLFHPKETQPENSPIDDSEPQGPLGFRRETNGQGIEGVLPISFLGGGSMAWWCNVEEMLKTMRKLR